MYSAFFVALSAFFAVANAGAVGGTNQCNTGNAQCCNQVYKSQSAEAKNLVGNLVGAALGPITALVGAQCSPLTIVGLGVQGNCNSNAVCCTGNTQNGLVNVGCVPIQL